ncbi:MAG TPA: C39 family peptidase [Polyangia bacterium]
MRNFIEVRSRRGTLFGLIVAAGVALAGCYHGTARSVSPAELRAQPGWVLVPGVPDVRQVSVRDCGPAALAMVLQRWGVPGSSRAEIEKALPPDTAATGAAAGTLRDLARSRGLKAFLISGRVEDLIHEVGAGRPVLVGLVQRYGKEALSHYEVVVGYNPVTRRLLLHDPGHGPREDGLDGFGEEWKPTGNLTLVVTGRAVEAAPGAAAAQSGT